MRRWWLYGVLVLLASALLLGTGGYSTIAADRGVDVAVADDSNAYLGIEDQSTVDLVDDGSTATALELTNNFAESGASVSASVPASAPVEVSTASFGDGVEVVCQRVVQRESVQVSVTATGGDTTVETTETVTVSCSPPPLEPEDVTFIGCGNAEIEGHPSQFPLNVTLIGDTGGSVAETDRIVEDPGDKTGGGSGSLAGLVIPGQQYVDRLVVTNPNYLNGTCSGSSNGNPATGEEGDPRDDIEKKDVTTTETVTTTDESSSSE